MHGAQAVRALCERGGYGLGAAQAEHQLGCALSDQERWCEAEPVLGRSLTALEAARGRNHLDLARACNGLCCLPYIPAHSGQLLHAADFKLEGYALAGTHFLWLQHGLPSREHIAGGIMRVHPKSPPARLRAAACSPQEEH